MTIGKNIKKLRTARGLTQDQLAEQLYRMLIALLEVAAHEALRLDDDVLDKLVLLLGRHGLPQFLHLF